MHGSLQKSKNGAGRGGWRIDADVSSRAIPGKEGLGFWRGDKSWEEVSCYVDKGLTADELSPWRSFLSGTGTSEQMISFINTKFLYTRGNLCSVF